MMLPLAPCLLLRYAAYMLMLLRLLMAAAYAAAAMLVCYATCYASAATLLLPISSPGCRYAICALPARAPRHYASH